ncbi:MAG: hypothetical protein ACJAQ3_004155, partial [Planctomycetota bacterium]
MSKKERGGPPRSRTRPLSLALPLAVLLGAIAWTSDIQAQPTPSPDDPQTVSVQLPTADQVSPKVSVLVTLSPGEAKPGSQVTLSVKAVIKPGWHIAAIDAPGVGAPSLPTQLDFAAMGLTPVAEAFAPSVEPERVKIGETTHLQHAGTVTWSREYRVDMDAGGYSGAGSIRFQVCDEKLCLPPKTLDFQLGGPSKEQKIATRLVRRSYQFIGEPIVVPLREAALSRSLLNPTSLVTADPDKDFNLYVQQLTSGMNAKEALTLGGTVEVDGHEVAIYLPKQHEYPLENTSKDETRYGNTSTFISIDHNGNGEIVDYESVATNLPIRLADSMFLVTSISNSEKTLTLQAIDTPLAGAVLNRKCPEFWYETVNGHVVSDRSIL